MPFSRAKWLLLSPQDEEGSLGEKVGRSFSAAF